MAEEKLITIKIQTDTETREIGKLQTELVKLTKRRNELNKKIRAGVKLTHKETAELGRLQPTLVATRNKLRDLERQVVKNNNALKKNSGFVAGVKKGMVQASKSMLLYVAGFAALTAIVGDTLTRIKEFDKTMVSLGAIMDKNRDELHNLELVIISVAGSSTSTSVEVAKLAESLITLGKTESEVKILLKPVNDLGIAMKTTSAEAGEFLVQTLNAFGKSSNEASEFADVIAKIRTSTALDFERMKDAFGFIAPTAKALGLTIQDTGALLGVLNDNGIKAARAGRLLSSSFAKLNKKGLTLDDALEKINNSTNKTKTATELFGTESFTLGLILANNIDKVDEYTEAFNNAGGSLEKLTNKQLDSLDAKLKILDSTWEKVILSIESGTGLLGGAFKGSVEVFTEALNGLWRATANISDVLQSDAIEQSGKLFKDFSSSVGGLSTNAEKVAFSLKELDFIQRDLKASVNVLNEDYGGLGASFDEIHEKSIEMSKAVGLNKVDFEAQREVIITNNFANEQLIESINGYIISLEKENKKIDENIEKHKELTIRKTTNEEIKRAELLSTEQIEIEVNERLKLRDEEQVNSEEITHKRILKNAETVEETRQKLKSETVNAAINLEHALFDVFNELQNRKLADLEKGKQSELKILEQKFKSGEISQEQFNANKLTLERGFSEETGRIRERQAKFAKAQAIISSGINTAMAVSQINANVAVNADVTQTLRGILTALVIGNGVAQTAAILASPVAQFATGGWVSGSGSGTSDSIDAKLSNGETVINAKSSGMFRNLLSDINVAGGGVDFSSMNYEAKTPHFATGGIASAESQQMNSDDLVNAMNERFDRITVVNVATETESTAIAVANIEEEVSF